MKYKSNLKYIILSSILLCIFLAGCGYTHYYDDCIERHPEFELYCDCIAAHTDGQFQIMDETYDKCFPLVPKNEMCEVKMYEV